MYCTPIELCRYSTYLTLLYSAQRGYGMDMYTEMERERVEYINSIIKLYPILYIYIYIAPLSARVSRVEYRYLPKLPKLGRYMILYFAVLVLVLVHEPLPPHQTTPHHATPRHSSASLPTLHRVIIYATPLCLTVPVGRVGT